jgi:hypothetical protein
MKKEKAIRISLPYGAKYRRVEVTDGGISIIYAEETANDTAKVSKTVLKAIPKPTPLIGGTKVYKKEGTPYWHCKIKDGRDEFMHLYLSDLTVDDVLYTADGKKREFVTERQKKFRADVMKALENMPEEGFRWIPVYEPSKDDDGNIQYVSGVNVLRRLNSYNWEETFQNYSPENGSRMSSITTYFLLLLRLLKDGFATVEQLADDSKEIGHYWDSKDAKHELEKTGERQIGGLYGFAGNTYKIVKDSESSSVFSILGGDYCANGDGSPLAHVGHVCGPNAIRSNCVGLLELTK